MLPFDRITVFCFAASYTCALAFELWHHFRTRPILRLISLLFGGAGLLAHTLFVLAQRLQLASPFGSLIFLGWILAVFYLYGSIHHRQVTWGIFVLPLVLGLTILANFSSQNSGPRSAEFWWQADFWYGPRFWGQIHGALVLLAAVGVSVGFVASVMYLLQARRLKEKKLPGQGAKLLSLERLETMNRRAIVWSFPLLTIGLLVGVFLGFRGDYAFQSWSNPKMLSVIGLWVVFAILLYLRYGAHARGRQVALWTILAFGLMVLSLVSPVHPFGPGGTP